MPLGDSSAHRNGAGAGGGAQQGGVEPGSAGPPSTGGGLLTALKEAAQTNASPAGGPVAGGAGERVLGAGRGCCGGDGGWQGAAGVGVEGCGGGVCWGGAKEEGNGGQLWASRD